VESAKQTFLGINLMTTPKAYQKVKKMSPEVKGSLAEAVRFELTNPRGLPVFKTGAIDHSATLPLR
jgi:hypothetical protein